MKPIRFIPYYKHVIWGGTRIADLKGEEIPGRHVGESWEISGFEDHESVVAEGEYAGLTISQLAAKLGAELLGNVVLERFGTRFPLIVKVIDAHADLSVQVHPDDEWAERKGELSGKNEMWYILRTDGEAKIYAGFNRRINRDELHALVEGHKLMDSVNAFDSRQGDVYWLPAGQVHAIGAGNLLLEVQQNSNVTYRLYDYGRIDADGRPRQLHISDAMDVLSLEPADNLKLTANNSGWAPDKPQMLCETESFTVGRYEIKESRKIENFRDSFMILFCENGSLEISDGEGGWEPIAAGHSVLIPASTRSFTVRGQGAIVTATL